MFCDHDVLTPEFIESISQPELAEIIRPSGFFNQKAGYLKAVTAWYKGYDYSVDNVKSEPLEKLRTELLSVKGVGRETADSVLLYAFGYPTFVVDAYTMRLCSRFPLRVRCHYEQVKEYFEKNIPKNVAVYNNYHALIVINTKEHCRKKPICNTCPLCMLCDMRY